MIVWRGNLNSAPKNMENIGGWLVGEKYRWLVGEKYWWLVGEKYRWLVGEKYRWLVGEKLLYSYLKMSEKEISKRIRLIGLG